MGQIKKIGDIYYIEFYARGLMYSQVAGTDEQDARKKLEQIEAKIAQGKSLTIVREIDLTAFFEQFLFHVRGQFSAKSAERFLKTWQHFRGFLDKNYPAIDKLFQITPSVVESYKTFLAKATKPKLVNLTLLFLREILEYGIRIGFINDNPTLHIRLLEWPKKIMPVTGGRFNLAKDLLGRGVGLGKVCQVLKLKDVAQIMYWSNFIPLQRQDVYN